MINKRKKKKALNIENEKSEEEKIFEELSIKLKQEIMVLEERSRIEEKRLKDIKIVKQNIK